jgi:hypothetical protein
MSHFSKIKTQITDKTLLIQAIQELEYVYVPEVISIKGFKGKETKVDLCISIPGETYEIGFLLANEKYQIVADWWGIGGMDKKTFQHQIMQKYAYLATKQALEKQGFQIAREETTSTGEIKIILRRMV